jgi:hypothetical protein
VNLDRETPLLLPADRRDWVPAGHWVHFAVAAMAATGVRAAPVHERGTGSEQYPAPSAARPYSSTVMRPVRSPARRSSARRRRTSQCVRSALIHIPAATLRTFRRKNAAPLQDGLTIPAEARRRQERNGQRARAAGKKPRGPDPAPGTQDQVHFTGAESCIVTTKAGFQQSCNAQAGAQTASRSIVGARVSQAPNDKKQLLPNLATVPRHMTPAPRAHRQRLCERGGRRRRRTGTRPASRCSAALQGEAHGRTVPQWDNPTRQAPATTRRLPKRMRQRTATSRGARALYKLREQTILAVPSRTYPGFRSFCLRGLAKVSPQWDLVTLAYTSKASGRLLCRPAGSGKRPVPRLRPPSAPPASLSPAPFRPRTTPSLSRGVRKSQALTGSIPTGC